MREVNIIPHQSVSLRKTGILVSVLVMNREPSTTSRVGSVSNADLNSSISRISCCPSASNVTRYFQWLSRLRDLIYENPVSSAAPAPRLATCLTQCIFLFLIQSDKNASVPSVDPSSTTSISEYQAAIIPSITPLIRVDSLQALMRNMILFFGILYCDLAYELGDLFSCILYLAEEEENKIK